MQSKRGKQNTAGKILLLIVSFLLLTSLPLIIFSPDKQKVVLQTPKSRFTFMTGTPRSVSDKHDLVYWEKVGTPLLFAKPDYKFGYSAFLRPEINYDKPERSGDRFLPILKQSTSVVFPGLPQLRKPESLLPEVKIPLTSLNETSPVIRKTAEPLFLREDGTPLSIKGITSASNSGNLDATVIRISRENKDLPPVIRIIQSCGNPQLDQRAVRALYRPAAENSSLTGVIRVEWNTEGEKK